MKNILNLFIIGTITLFLGSCTLDVQDSFEFVPDNTFADPFSETTALEFINQGKTIAIPNEDGEIVLDPDQFDLMAAAIKRVGYERFYNLKGRTYLLIRNNAFTGNNVNRSIWRILTGSQLTTRRSVNPDELMAELTEPEQINRLKAILRYHIVNALVLQNPTLEVQDQDFVFNTLLPELEEDVNGEATGVSASEFNDISFRRDVLWKIRINEPGAPLPLIATQNNRRVELHNFAFANNSVGHHIDQIVLFRPYTDYSNFSID